MVNFTTKSKDFSLDNTFDCGQCFRFSKDEDGSYIGVAYEKVVSFYYDEKTEILKIENCNKKDFQNIWEEYLDLKRDYGEIKAFLSEKDSIIKEAISYGQGIRILKQEKWETLISFIISQNNHIPRIKKCIESICVNFGKPLGEFKGKEYYGFPTMDTIANLTVSDLEICKLGYRAKYIIETAKAVKTDNGDKLNSSETESLKYAYEYLTELSGVGPKVANCIILFSMAKWEAFPIDVWVRRVMHHLYGIEEKDLQAMANYAENHFAPWTGIAQQYLFYYVQSKGIELKK